MNLFTLILYILWGIMSALTFITPFSVEMGAFWKWVLWISGGFNFIVNLLNVPEIIKWLKNRKD